MNALESEIKDLVRYWTFPHLRPRRFHAFGVGTAKSGTHSLDRILGHYRAFHEPERERFMGIIMARADGAISNSRARDEVRKLDRRKWLEFNSSYLNYFLLDLLLDAFPQAKFVLTIRDCYSWLDSIFNELLARPHGEYQTRFHRWYAESLSLKPHEKGDQVLSEHGLWPLDGWLRVWSQHNARVLALVPDDRLLIIRTPDIRRDMPRLAEFLDISPDTLDATRSHEYKAERKLGLLSRIDEEYLSACVDARCGDLMRRFFPEIRRLSDVPGYQPQDDEALAS